MRCACPLRCTASSTSLQCIHQAALHQLIRGRNPGNQRGGQADQSGKQEHPSAGMYVETYRHSCGRYEITIEAHPQPTECQRQLRQALRQRQPKAGFQKSTGEGSDDPDWRPGQRWMPNSVCRAVQERVSDEDWRRWRRQSAARVNTPHREWAIGHATMLDAPSCAFQIGVRSWAPIPWLVFGERSHGARRAATVAASAFASEMLNAGFEYDFMASESVAASRSRLLRPAALDLPRGSSAPLPGNSPPNSGGALPPRW